MIRKVDEGWRVVENHHLERDFEFADFAKALEFTNRVGAIAEAEKHHPEIHLRWGEVQLIIFTKKRSGLSESDFFLAAKIDRIPVEPLIRDHLEPSKMA